MAVAVGTLQTGRKSGHDLIQLFRLGQGGNILLQAGLIGRKLLRLESLDNSHMIHLIQFLFHGGEVITTATAAAAAAAATIFRGNKT